MDAGVSDGHGHRPLNGTVKGSKSKERLDAYDLLGPWLVATFAVWTAVSGFVQAANPLPQVLLLAVVFAAYLGGRRLGRPGTVSAVIVVVILVLTVASGPRALAGGPLAPPLDYANANGALYALGMGSAAVAATAVGRSNLRWLFWSLAVVLLALTAASESRAAFVLAVVVLLIALGSEWVGRRLALVAPLVVLVTVVVTIVVGLTQGAREISLIEQGFSERRAVLWQDAMQMVANQPVFGVGPGMFSSVSPTALGDDDARWAHSGYLQVAGETGIIGALLLMAVLLWVFGALYRSRQDARLVAIGAAAVAALTVHAAVDYVFHFPALLVAAALLTGSISSRRTGTRPRSAGSG